MKLVRFFAGPVLAGIVVGLAVLWWYELGPGASGYNPLQRPAQTYATAVNRAAPAVVNIYTTQVVVRDTPDSDDELLNRFLEERAASDCCPASVPA